MSKAKKNMPDFDQKLADSYVGKYILVGITYLDHASKLLGHEQMHGIIESANFQGIKIALRGSRMGQTWSLPPDLKSIHLAAPGSYTLKDSEETIENPDLLSTWSVTKPAQN